MTLYTQDECCWVYFYKTTDCSPNSWYCARLKKTYYQGKDGIDCPYPYRFYLEDLLIWIPKAFIMDNLQVPHQSLGGVLLMPTFVECDTIPVFLYTEAIFYTIEQWKHHSSNRFKMEQYYFEPKRWNARWFVCFET